MEENKKLEEGCLEDRKVNWADNTAMLLAIVIVGVVIYTILGHFLNL